MSLVVAEVAVVAYTDEEKEEAIDLYLREGGQVAAEAYGVTLGTMVRWVKEAGLVGARVALVREAMELRKAELADSLLTDAAKLRDQLFRPAKVITWDEGELRQEQIDEPTFADKERIVKSVGGLVDSVIKLAGGTTDAPVVVPVQVNIVREGGGV